MKSLLQCALIYSYLLVGHVLFAQSDLPVFTARIQQVAGALEATIDLGILNAGEPFVAQLELVNDLPFEIPIERMTTYCSCIQLSSRSQSIPPGGSVILDLKFKVPTDGKTASGNTAFWIHYGESSRISVYLQCVRGGVVSFKNSVHYHTRVALGNRTHQFRIPILVTEPAKLSSIAVTTQPVNQNSRNLEKLETSLSQDSDGTQWLNCLIPVDEDSSTMMGLIWLKDSILGRQAEIRIVVEVVKGVDIIPRVVRFTRSSDSPDAKASVIVKFDKSLLEMQKSQNSELPVSIEFRREAGRIPVESIRMAPGIYRVTLSIPNDGDDPLDRETIGDLEFVGNTGKSVINITQIQTALD
jgi:hypothetical protein